VRTQPGELSGIPSVRPPKVSHVTQSPSPTYEQARDELAEIVRQLEQGGASLEQSLALWERGEELATVCQSWLDGAKARLDAALSGGQGAEQDGATADASGARPL
jgi:exodeoxyribonuclease VII small subunit